MAAHNISPSELARLKRARWMCRTDLHFLCTEVLGYRDIRVDVHGPVLNIVQKFPLPLAEHITNVDIVKPNFIRYLPHKDLYSLPGGRRVLLLDPRSGLKTTINAISHSIQWLLNYPHIAVAIIQSSDQKAQDIIKEIKYHFQYNQRFREIFPDYCPQKGISDWGNMNGFTLPNKIAVCEALRASPHKEPSVMSGSIDKGLAGYHFDVMKFSDIVEPNNTRTSQQIENVCFQFAMQENLLVRPDSWIDVEGTRYHHADLYGRIIDGWLKASPEDRKWRIHVRGCYLKDTYGQPRQYTPDELALPFAHDDKGQFISWWPDRFPVTLLESERVDPARSEEVFATQRLNDPIAMQGSRRPFPVNDKYPVMISRDDFARVPIAYYTISIDTADTQNVRSNFTVFSVGAWDKYGRCYICEIVREKFLPDEIVKKLFELNKKYRPRTVFIEETAFVRGLSTSIARERDKSNQYVPLVFGKRDNQVSKTERILNGLQPWYKSGEIRFLSDLVCLHDLKKELSEFPKGMTDDIIDTLADIFLTRGDWFGREAPTFPDASTREAAVGHEFLQSQQRDFSRRYLGISPPGEDEALPIQSDEFFIRTGGM